MNKKKKIFDIPSENVIDLRKLLLEEEKKAKKKSGALSFLTPKKKSKSKKIHFQVAWRHLAIFSIICLFLTIPLFLGALYQNINQVKGRVLGSSVIAMERLKEAGVSITNFNLEEAEKQFIAAGESFKKSEEELKRINKFLFFVLKFIPFKGKVISSGQHLLAAGRNMAEIGQIISEEIRPLSSNNFFQKNKIDFAQIIFRLDESFTEIERLFQKTKKDLAEVDIKSLPEEYQDEVYQAKNLIAGFDQSLIRLKESFAVAKGFLAPKGQKDYLFIFQNNNEIRATGGFIGSLALVNVNRGKVKILEVPSRGPYEINDDFQKDIIPPKPLWLINNKWQIQDANWFPDFPTSAEKINWFYEQARGFSLDGIVALTPQVVVNLLRVTGPITLDKYNLTVSSDNFIQETQRKVESDYNEELNRPKEVIADLIPVLLGKVFAIKDKRIFDLVSYLNKSLREKDILIYFKDKKLEEEVISLDWGGEMKNPPRDYLMVVNSNIGGGKTDGVIQQEIYHQAEILKDGSIIDTLKIKRSHQGDSNDEFTKIKNMDYMRIYVPEGSQLIEAKGFDKIDKNLIIYPDAEASEDEFLLRQEKDPIIHERSNTRITREFNKTAFANWQGLEVGETKEVFLKYRLPFKIDSKKDIYSLYIQKQPGSQNTKIQTELVVDKSFSIEEQTDNNANLAPNVIRYSDELVTDKLYWVVLKKE